MEVQEVNNIILLPDSIYFIFGVEKLIKDFCNKNKIDFFVYNLEELKKSLKKKSISHHFTSVLNKEILLMLVPVSITVDALLFKLFNNKIHCFGTPATGSDHVDFYFLNEYQIPFFDAPGENKDSVVEYVLSSLPYVIKEEDLEKRKLTFAIIGYGRIGSLLGTILKELGFRIIPVDPFIFPEEYKNNYDCIFNCDIITFHVPLTKEGEYPTYEMVNLDFIKKLKKNQIVINTSRGKIISLDAYKLLIQKNICVMDVYYQEPPNVDLLKSDSLIIATPHIAGYNWISRFRSFFKVLKDFSYHFELKFNYEIEDFLPNSYEIEIFDCIMEHTIQLKKNVNYFYIRNQYPVRSSIKFQKYNKNWKKFHKVLYDYFISF